MSALGFLADNARSLMENVTSEHHDSIVVKFIGGMCILREGHTKIDSMLPLSVLTLEHFTPTAQSKI